MGAAAAPPRRGRGGSVPKPEVGRAGKGGSTLISLGLLRLDCSGAVVAHHSGSNPGQRASTVRGHGGHGGLEPRGPAHDVGEELQVHGPARRPAGSAAAGFGGEAGHAEEVLLAETNLELQAFCA